MVFKIRIYNNTSHNLSYVKRHNATDKWPITSGVSSHSSAEGTGSGDLSFAATFQIDCDEKDQPSVVFAASDPFSGSCKVTGKFNAANTDTMINVWRNMDDSTTKTDTSQNGYFKVTSSYSKKKGNIKIWTFNIDETIAYRNHKNEEKERKQRLAEQKKEQAEQKRLRKIEALKQKQLEEQRQKKEQEMLLAEQKRLIEIETLKQKQLEEFKTQKKLELEHATQINQKLEKDLSEAQTRNMKQYDLMENIQQNMKLQLKTIRNAQEKIVEQLNKQIKENVEVINKHEMKLNESSNIQQKQTKTIERLEYQLNDANEKLNESSNIQQKQTKTIWNLEYKLNDTTEKYNQLSTDYDDYKQQKQQEINSLKQKEHKKFVDYNKQKQEEIDSLKQEEHKTLVDYNKQKQEEIDLLNDKILKQTMSIKIEEQKYDIFVDHANTEQQRLLQKHDPKSVTEDWYKWKRKMLNELKKIVTKINNQPAKEYPTFRKDVKHLNQNIKTVHFDTTSAETMIKVTKQKIFEECQSNNGVEKKNKLLSKMTRASNDILDEPAKNESTINRWMKYINQIMARTYPIALSNFTLYLVMIAGIDAYFDEQSVCNLTFLAIRWSVFAFILINVTILKVMVSVRNNLVQNVKEWM
eukprot:68631_1